jgi:hypothetical protein
MLSLGMLGTPHCNSPSIHGQQVSQQKKKISDVQVSMRFELGMRNSSCPSIMWVDSSDLRWSLVLIATCTREDCLTNLLLVES